MKVSELERQVGIAPGAVRFYERKSLLPVARREENGYRRYDETDVCRLRVVVALRGVGRALTTQRRAGRRAGLLRRLTLRPPALHGPSRARAAPCRVS